MCNLLSSAVFDLPVWCVIANNTSTFLHKCLKCLDLRNSMEISNQMLYPSVTRRTKATDLAVSAGIIVTGIVHTTGANLFVDSRQPSISRNCGSLFTCCWPVSFAFSSPPFIMSLLLSPQSVWSSEGFVHCAMMQFVLPSVAEICP